MPDGSSTAHLYRPKLASALAEGYSFEKLKRDALAGLTVAIVALPLSMAIAVASGVTPERGLIAAIVGGFLVSALGGSRYQIGGPAGAFIVLVAQAGAQFGLQGLLTAVFVSGFLLALLGALRIGTLVRLIPAPVTVGFIAGIAATIAASQFKDLAGLPSAHEPGHFFPKLAWLAQALPATNLAALALGVVTAGGIALLRKLRPTWPHMLIAVIAASLAVALLHLPVETIGSRFGALPHGLAMPVLPALSWAAIVPLLPSILAFTLLGGVESLLSAKVADSMTGRKHRSNMELVAQGIANMASACFGGISVTGTIARTATNIRAGAVSPVSGILHAVLLLVFLAVAAPLAGFVPLAALAGVLIVVCWNMVEWDHARAFLATWPTALVLVATLAMTLIFDLTAGIAAGCCTALLFAAGERVRAAASPPRARW